MLSSQERSTTAADSSSSLDSVESIGIALVAVGSPVVKRRGGVIYANDTANNNKNEAEQEEHQQATNGASHVPLVRLKYPEIRSKSILKVKSLEDSLRVVTGDQKGNVQSGGRHDKDALRRRSSAYQRLWMNLQSRRRMSSRKDLKQEEPSDRNEMLGAITNRNGEPLGDQDTVRQAQQGQRQQPKGEIDNHVHFDEDESIGVGPASTVCRDNTACHENPPQPPRRVSFTTISIRSYSITVNDNPCVAAGPAIGLSWMYEELPDMNLDDYELLQKKGTTKGVAPRPPEELRLRLDERQRLLRDMGVPAHEIRKFTRRIQASRRQRLRTLAQVRHQERQVLIEQMQQKQKRQPSGQGKLHCNPSKQGGGKDSIITQQPETEPLMPFWWKMWRLYTSKTDEELEDELWDRAQQPMQQNRRRRKWLA